MRLNGTVRRRLARGLGLLLASAVVAGGLVARAGAHGTLALTAEQQSQLANGEIVVLDARPPGASSSAGGGTAVAIVEAPVERVWDVLTDYPGHRRFYPNVVAAEVVETSGARLLVRYTVRIGILNFRFHMRTVSDPVCRRIEWRLDEDRANSLLRENSGYWLLEAHPGGGTLVTYALAVRSYVPAFLTTGTDRKSLVDTIQGLRRVVAGPPGDAAGR